MVRGKEQVVLEFLKILLRGDVLPHLPRSIPAKDDTDRVHASGRGDSQLDDRAHLVAVLRIEDATGAVDESADSLVGTRRAEARDDVAWHESPVGAGIAAFRLEQGRNDVASTPIRIDPSVDLIADRFGILGERIAQSLKRCRRIADLLNEDRSGFRVVILRRTEMEKLVGLEEVVEIR